MNKTHVPELKTRLLPAEEGVRWFAGKPYRWTLVAGRLVLEAGVEQ